MSSCALYMMAVRRQYDDLVDHVRNKNKIWGLAWKDKDGNTVLHILCRQLSSSVPIDAICCISTKSPELVMLANYAGWTPFHLLASRAAIPSSEDAKISQGLLVMTKVCPKGVSVRRTSGFNRETPFDLACAGNATIQVIRFMLETDPTLAQMSLRLYTAYNNSSIMNRWWQSRSMEKMELVLLTALLGRPPSAAELEHDDHHNHPFLLHAACYQRVPREFFENCVIENPSQALLVDKRGNLPLHYALLNASVDAQPYTQHVVQSLLSIDQKTAGLADMQGRYPLHMALASKMTWHSGGVQELVFAHPPALRVLDPETNLFPFEEAARNANKSRLHLSTLLELLQASPEMVGIAQERSTSEDATK